MGCRRTSNRRASLPGHQCLPGRSAGALAGGGRYALDLPPLRGTTVNNGAAAPQSLAGVGNKGAAYALLITQLADKCDLVERISDEVRARGDEWLSKIGSRLRVRKRCSVTNEIPQQHANHCPSFTQRVGYRGRKSRLSIGLPRFPAYVVVVAYLENLLWVAQQSPMHDVPLRLY